MPELPEVETIKTGMAKAIGQSLIKNVIIRQPKLREDVPADFADKITGTSIISYQRIAKYIIINLSGDLSLIWHMGMSGKVLITDALPTPLGKHDHVIIETANGFMVYNDPRRFGLLTYCKTEELQNHPRLCAIGIEPFDKALTAQYLFTHLQKKKIPIKVALLDQRIIVGIGNIYASEVLFGAGISPLRPAAEVLLAECEKLVQNVCEVLSKAIAAGGSTLRDYEKPDGSLGYFQNQHCVYNKTGQRCPGCTCDIAKTGGIQKTVQAGRSTFYCPKKQK